MGERGRESTAALIFIFLYYWKYTTIGRHSEPPMSDFPALSPQFLAIPDRSQLEPTVHAGHPPRILLLYGSLRKRSFSRLLVEEAALILQRLGAETRIFDPRDLRCQMRRAPNTPRCRNCAHSQFGRRGRSGAARSVHGADQGNHERQMTGFRWKSAAVRPTQGRTLAVMQVSGGLAVIQCGQHDAASRPLDADDHHPEPIFCRQGLRGI